MGYGDFDVEIYLDGNHYRIPVNSLERAKELLLALEGKGVFVTNLLEGGATYRG